MTEASSACDGARPFSFELPEPGSPPSALLVMAGGFGRARISEVLASVGWSVTVLDDGWSLLDHLAGAGVRPLIPSLAVVELAVAGPRVNRLVQGLRALYFDLPVLFVGGAREGAPGAILRPPFLARRVISAVRRVAGAAR